RRLAAPARVRQLHAGGRAAGGPANAALRGARGPAAGACVVSRPARHLGDGAGDRVDRGVGAAGCSLPALGGSQEVVSAGGLWEVSVESVLAQNYCDVGGLGRCVAEGAIADLLRRYVVKSAPAENGLSKFPHVPDPEGLRREFLAAARSDPGIAAADALMCSEPPFFCALFLGLGKPIVGYIGNPFGAYLKPGGPQ
ncbi:unnamed protein product, partial [Prorocentrum cordatum]